LTTRPLTPAEAKHIETIALWLDSMRDWLALQAADPDQPLPLDTAAPGWVKNCVARLDHTIFAPVQANLPEAVPTPYRVGYAFGLMKWGTGGLTGKIPREVRLAVKKIRLSKKARRQVVRLWQDFLISAQILTRKNGRLQPAYLREINLAARAAQKYTGPDESEFHRGVATGLRGLGRDVPGDRSTDATNIHLLLVLWWRFVVRFESVTQLHAWLTRIFGPALAGDRKRTEKICQRIKLRFRERGRPRKNPTPAPLS